PAARRRSTAATALVGAGYRPLPHQLQPRNTKYRSGFRGSHDHRRARACPWHPFPVDGRGAGAALRVVGEALRQPRWAIHTPIRQQQCIFGVLKLEGRVTRERLDVESEKLLAGTGTITRRAATGVLLNQRDVEIQVTRLIGVARAVQARRLADLLVDDAPGE